MKWPQPLRFLLIQSACALWFFLLPASPWVLLGASASAVLLAWRWHDGWWWWIIHAFFLPLILLAQQFDIAPVWYLFGFILLWLVFSPAITSRVPLYLSGEQALRQLEGLLLPDMRVLDLGAGTGTVLRWLARRRSDVGLTGIEQAFLPWLMGRLTLSSRVRWLRGDYADLNLGDYDVVYAFLSPAAMLALWEKAQVEMKPGSLLISNTFAVPGVEADAEVALHDWKNGKLLIWRM